MNCRRRCARAGRPGGRPGAAARPAALAGLSAGRGLWRDSTTAIRPTGLAAARLGAPADRGRSAAARHRRRLPAARRRAGRRRRPGDRRPRLRRRRRTRSRPSPAPSPRACWTAACCRCSSTSPATAAPPPTATRSCRWSTPTARRWKPPTSPHSGRSPNLPLGMTAHVVFTAIDPVAPATTSATMIREVIRGFIGFDGLLMSDDISMGALSGIDRRAQRAPRSRPAAIWCSTATASSTRCGRSPAQAPELAGEAARRADAALARAQAPDAIRSRRRAARVRRHDGGERTRNG